jgi:hypothetical protein
MVNREAIEQIKVAEFVKQCTDLPFIHIANERRTSPQQGALLKRMGVRAGVSDIFIPRANQYYHGLFIELKTLTGKASPAQKQFVRDMIAEGYEAVFAYGAEDCIAIIKEFYGI